MPLAVLLSLAVLATCGGPPPESPPAKATAQPDTTMTLFDFGTDDGATWRVENDGVMGGDSQGFVDVAGGTLTFTGEVVTQGGGFTSVRARRDLDISAYDGIELRVRGGRRTFELDVDDGTQSRGREVNRVGTFPTAEAWQTVRVPFDDLETTAHGEPVSVDPLDRSAIRSVGIYIADGIDGPFRLEVDWIRAYAE